ncbi:MAG: hypothetical protein GY849_12160, partial [Deltaproteobacteria bacterium]|nr:hypothetical protein [Deltaproteobacteria bacterium]
PFIFEPEIEGIAQWLDKRTLEFRPNHRLAGRQKYRADLVLSQLTGNVTAPGRFNFEFETMDQAFEITLDGLQASDPKSLVRQQLSGAVITADTEDNTNIEAMIKASQQGRPLNVGWSHAANSREHGFVIQDIERTDNETEVALEWDGKPIGVNKKGKKLVPVSPLGSFTVLQARPIQEETQYIEIGFSDPLKRRQNLQGLIRVDGKSDLKFAIERN